VVSVCQRDNRLALFSSGLATRSVQSNDKTHIRGEGDQSHEKGLTVRGTISLSFGSEAFLRVKQLATAATAWTVRISFKFLSRVTASDRVQ
jgi:hypothetical protein